jgi:uncharacterized protein YbcI
MNPKRLSPLPSPLHELSNSFVSLHRDFFGRGPANAHSTLQGEVAVCVLTDIYTASERRLIRGGHGAEVMDLRLSHQRLCEAQIREAAAAALGRPVLAVLSSFHIEPDIAIECFVLAP